MRHDQDDDPFGWPSDGDPLDDLLLDPPPHPTTGVILAPERTRAYPVDADEAATWEEEQRGAYLDALHDSMVDRASEAQGPDPW
jgi:hypothetical protein